MILAGNTVQCTVPEAPKIVVNPVTDPIQYEFSYTSQQLSAFKTNTVSPYAPGTDTTTGGLRHDRPQIGIGVEWGTMSYPDRQVTCMWYKSVTVTIKLSPKIYVAKENSQPKCRNAILEHEKKHVVVDRKVINRYARGIGQAIKNAVDQIGPIGPYNNYELDSVQKQLLGHVQAAVDSQKFLLYQEMARQQAQVDTLEEYERVNKICESAKR